MQCPCPQATTQPFWKCQSAAGGLSVEPGTDIWRVDSTKDILRSDGEGGYKQIVIAAAKGSEAALTIFEDLIHPYWKKKV
jgi:hypothetical protein